MSNPEKMTVGEKKHISFELNESDTSGKLIHLNFYLGGKLISEEPVYIPAYLESFKRFLSLLAKEHYHNPNIENLELKQRFRKLNNERNSDEPQFFRHLFRLDETIDQYTIFVFQSIGTTEFVWTCSDIHHCNNDHKPDHIYTTRIPTTVLSSTVHKLVEELKKRIV